MANKMGATIVAQVADVQLKLLLKKIENLSRIFFYLYHKERFSPIDLS